jgi:monoamine oxidase
VPDRLPGNGVLDLAVVGAGAAGTYVAYHALREHPSWSVALFERTDRIGGRLRSLPVEGLDHPIELGGMRFLTSHRYVAETVARFGIPTHPFDETGGLERSFLRGVFGTGAGDPSAGRGYDLPEPERGRSALDLGMAAFRAIVADADALTGTDWEGLRHRGTYRDRPLTDWSLAEAMATVLSAEGHRFMTDAFGYDSGVRAQNAGNAIEYLLGAGDPSAEARVPDAGMHTIPQALAAGFEDAGGRMSVGRQLDAVDQVDGLLQLRFADGEVVAARRVALTLPAPALALLSDASPLIDVPAVRTIVDAVEAFPAVKLYLWYDRPWWLGDGTAIRLTTDLPLRKVFYFGQDPDRPAALLASYTDGRHAESWRELAAGAGGAGSPAPRAMVDAATRQLREVHPRVDAVPEPAGSAFSHWGADPHETGWHYWRAGSRSDDVIAAARQPIDGVDLYLCGEAFSHAQGWVEGALDSARDVVDRLTTS